MSLESSMNHTCHGATPEDLRHFDRLSFTLDWLGHLIGLVGLLGNCLAVPALLSKRLVSVFNRILVFLAAFDSVFIFCSIMEGVWRNFGAISDWHNYAYAYFGYQLQSIAILSSIFTTVVLALERYLAITRPIEYHNAVQGANPWRRVFSYVVPVVICSTIFNIPKFLETKVVERTYTRESINQSSIIRTTISVEPTDLRLSDDYIFWYNNLAKLVVTGLLPFLSLCFFNAKIYLALRTRRRQMGPNATLAHAQQLNEDNRQALVLFSIVIIFLICNVPRIVLNLHEVFTIEQYKLNVSLNCYTLPFWVLLSGTLSQLLMVINSSVNFFIYCFMSSLFREVLSEQAKSAIDRMSCETSRRRTGDDCGGAPRQTELVGRSGIAASTPVPLLVITEQV